MIRELRTEWCGACDGSASATACDCGADREICAAHAIEPIRAEKAAISAGVLYMSLSLIRGHSVDKI